MTNPSPGRPMSLGNKWKVILGIGLGLIGIAIVAALVAGGYFYNVLSVVKPSESYGVCDFLNAKSAVDKLRILENSQKQHENGFVGLNELEVNSMLNTLFFSRKPKPISSFPDAPQAIRTWTASVRPKIEEEASPARLLDARAVFEMDSNEVVWICWVKRTWRGHAKVLQWERRVRLAHKADGWCFILEGMRVGSRDIPERFWPQTTEFLGDADTDMAPIYLWFQKLPAVCLKPNEKTMIPELVVYNYPDGKVLAKTSP